MNLRLDQHLALEGQLHGLSHPLKELQDKALEADKMALQGLRIQQISSPNL